jgi:hypothetical protein
LVGRHREWHDLRPNCVIPDGKPWLIERVRELIAFLRDSGGFEIW